MNVDYDALMKECGTTSDAMMMLTFLETLHRYGSSFGGVSSAELALRHGAAYHLHHL
jgi:hypothetical protein